MLRRISTQFKRSKDSKDSKESKESKEPKDCKDCNGDIEPKSIDKSSRRASKISPAPKSTSTKEDNHVVKRAEVVAVFERYAQAIHASQEPLPNQTSDGAYLKHDKSSGLINDIKALGFRDINTVKDLIASKASGELVDDKTYLMERIIQMVADLPGNSKNRTELTSIFLDELWNSLPHPPLS